jgi:archaellum component FlaC
MITTGSTYPAAVLLGSGASRNAEKAQAQDAPNLLSGKRSEREEDALRTMKAVVDTLRRAPDEADKTAQAQARKRVEALKERIKMLKQFYGMDPKALARALNQIASELKSALKDYASAGGRSSDLGVNAALAAGGAASAGVEGAGVTEGADATQAEAEAAKVEASAQQASQEAQGAAAQAETEARQNGSDASDDPSSSPAGQEEQTGPGRAFYLAKREAELKDDQEFAKTVRELTQEIKALFQKAKSDAANKSDSSEKASDKRALEETRDEIEELEDELKDFSNGVNEELGAVQLELSFVQSAAAAPAPNIAITV